MPERQVTAEGVEQHAPSLTFDITKTDTEYTITYTVVGTFEYRLDDGTWQEDVDGSPLTITRTTEDQTVFLRATVGNLRMTSSVPINALASAPDQRFIASVRLVSQDTGSDAITIAWDAAANSQPGDYYELVWVRGNSVASGSVLGVTSPYAHGPSGSGGHGLDLVLGGTPDTMYYVVRVLDSSGALVGQSSQIAVTVDRA